MALNLSSLVSLGSTAVSAFKLNPVAMLYKIGAGIGVCAVIYGTGYVTGCTHQKNSEATEKLAQEHQARIIEGKDAKQGNVAAAQVRATENQIDANTKNVRDQSKGKKLVECKQPAPTPNLEPKNVETKETDVAYLTPDAVRLYDLSLEPGLASVRARAYETPGTVQVNEGFDLIEKNNGYCRKIAKQLDAVITRIEQKQQLSKE